MTNTKKTILNFVISIGSQLIILVMGLVIPRIVLIHYGSDTNGLISTITQIFTYMALLEAGISASAKNALYKPIKENDRRVFHSICLQRKDIIGKFLLSIL